MQADVKDDDRDAEADARHRAGRRSTLVSVAVNIGLTAVQLSAGLISGSQALVADAVHSLSDLVSDFVVLFAGHHSRKGPDADHQYGHQRFETAASLALGMLLLAVGIGMLWAAGQKVQSPESHGMVRPIALYVALLALVSKELLFRYMLAVATRVRSGMLVANAWHARSDAASSLVVALGIGGNLLGYHFLDPVAAMVVGLVVTRMGWRFGSDALGDLMDRAVDAQSVEAIRASLASAPGVRGVHDVRTRKMGDLILADAHLEVDGTLTIAQGHDIVTEARRRALALPNVLNVMIHVDPAQTSAVQADSRTESGAGAAGAAAGPRG